MQRNFSNRGYLKNRKTYSARRPKKVAALRRYRMGK